jgi:hypothetical protein
MEEPSTASEADGKRSCSLLGAGPRVILSLELEFARVRRDTPPAMWPPGERLNSNGFQLSLCVASTITIGLYRRIRFT